MMDNVGLFIFMISFFLSSQDKHELTQWVKLGSVKDLKS